MLAASQCGRLACVALCMISTTAPARTPGVRYRKNVKAMTIAEWTTLERAIRQLQTNDSGNTDTGSSGERHDSYAYFVKRHREESVHYGELIWPWHRAFLLQFEDALNKVKRSDDLPIALPYWDWAEQSDGQIGYPSAYENTGSVLYMSDRTPYARADYPNQTPFCIATGLSCDPTALYPAARFLQQVLSASDWLSFGGGKEGRDPEIPMNTRVHLVIHDQYVKGTMGPASTAAKDPLFWAHHANLDRLVSNWQIAHPGTDACGECETLVYVDPVAVQRFTVRSLLNNDALPRGRQPPVQVVYVQPPNGSGPIRTMPRPTIAAPQTVAKHVTLAGEVSQFGFTLPVLSDASLTLKMTNVKVPVQHSYVVDVFVFPASVTFEKNDEFGRRYFAGRFALMAEDHGRVGGRGAGRAIVAPSHEITVTTELADAVAAIAGPSDAKNFRMAILVRPSERLEYKAIADDVNVGEVELLHRQGSTTHRIDLQPTAASPVGRQR
jgi:hypothetical protein